MASQEVLIFDTTLRDGEQAPGNSLSPEEKLRLARQLDALRVDIIEAGFPAASEDDFRSVREIAAGIGQQQHRRILESSTRQIGVAALDDPVVMLLAEGAQIAPRHAVQVE